MVSFPKVSEISFRVLFSFPPRNKTQEQLPTIVSAKPNTDTEPNADTHTKPNIDAKPNSRDNKTTDYDFNA